MINSIDYEVLIRAMKEAVEPGVFVLYPASEEERTRAYNNLREILKAASND